MLVLKFSYCHNVAPASSILMLYFPPTMLGACSFRILTYTYKTYITYVIIYQMHWVALIVAKGGRGRIQAQKFRNIDLSYDLWVCGSGQDVYQQLESIFAHNLFCPYFVLPIIYIDFKANQVGSLSGPKLTILSYKKPQKWPYLKIPFCPSGNHQNDYYSYICQWINNA